MNVLLLQNKIFFNHFLFHLILILGDMNSYQEVVILVDYHIVGYVFTIPMQSIEELGLQTPSVL